MGTVVPVNTDDAAARGARPSFLFGRHKFPDPVFFDRGEILEHAHAVARPIAFVQPPEPGAGIRGARETPVPSGSSLFETDRHFTADAVSRLGCIVSPAPVAAVLLPEIPAAEGAIHSARRDKLRCYFGG